MADSHKPSLRDIADNVERRYQGERRVLSFADYLTLFEANPRRLARDAATYTRDMFDHYGTRTVERPVGKATRYNLFDLPWEAGGTGDRNARGTLIGQEAIQQEIYRSLCNFVREGKPNRLVMMHGPNGSSKSTTVACIMAGLEHYSTTDEGMLYRFHWVFPSNRSVRGSLGFYQSAPKVARDSTSFAYLSDEQLDAKLLVEVRDHPLFLFPQKEREAFLRSAFGAYDDAAGVPEALREPPSEWIVRGELSHKSQRVFEALLASYNGSFHEVLKHVQVERYLISRRYRVGAVTIGPQMSVDAGERQVTMDKSLSALPPSLQALSLFEVRGELVDAAGGVLEFSDLLKRPVDAFKYLQLSVETGEVALTQQNVQLNCVMMGSCNDLHLDAFREHPEFASFRGRMELLRTPYLLSYKDEQAIYDTYIVPQIRRHVSPHATYMAALFAVLTRMKKPLADRYDKTLAPLVSSLSALEKADLYAIGKVPERLVPDARKVLFANIDKVFSETADQVMYEGRLGASPREMRGVLFDAAQSPRYPMLSPLSVLDAIAALCRRKSEFEWLELEPLPGGYHNVPEFLEVLRNRLLDCWEEAAYGQSGLVEEGRYEELLERYVQHVSAWVKKERIYNRVTQRHEEPDPSLMGEVERLVEAQGDSGEFRRNLISSVAAWALDHPDEKWDVAVVFGRMLSKLRQTIYESKRKQVASLLQNTLVSIKDGATLDTADAALVRDFSARLAAVGYSQDCIVELSAGLLKTRFADA